MRLLKIAMEKRRWDLAAHTIVLASARILKNGAGSAAGKRVSRSPAPRSVTRK